MSKRKIGAVVAAAGLSSRMGDFKPLLPLDGDTVIGRCLSNLRGAGATDIVVVTGHRAGELAEALADSGVTIIHNAAYAETQMFDSLCLGLRALPADCEKILLTPGDVPLVRTGTIRALLNADAGFASPICNGKRGHPVVLDPAWREAVLAFEGDDGLRGAVKTLGIPAVEIEVEDPGMHIDLDTQEDYRGVLGFFNR